MKHGSVVLMLLLEVVHEVKLLLCLDPCDPALKMAAFRPGPRCGLDFIGASLKDHKFSEFERDSVCVCVCNWSSGVPCEICFFLMDTNVVSNHENKLASDEPELEAPRGPHGGVITPVELGACPQAPASVHAG